MRNLTTQEMDSVSGAGDQVKVLSDILSNFLNDSLNCNTIASGNSILNFVGNTVDVDIL